MIQRTQMLEMLLEACPSFVDHFTNESKSYTINGETLYYIVLADLAQHLLSLIAENKFAEIKSTFATVEVLQTNGDPFVREAITIGLLEALQNISSHDDGFDKKTVLEWLGPESRKWWDRLEDFWNGNPLALRDPQV